MRWWNYRVIQYEESFVNPITKEEETVTLWRIAEVYYLDEDNPKRPTSWTMKDYNPSPFVSVEGIKFVLDKLSDAMDKPILKEIVVDGEQKLEETDVTPHEASGMMTRVAEQDPLKYYNSTELENWWFDGTLWAKVKQLERHVEENPKDETGRKYLQALRWVEKMRDSAIKYGMTEGKRDDYADTRRRVTRLIKLKKMAKQVQNPDGQVDVNDLAGDMAHLILQLIS